MNKPGRNEVGARIRLDQFTAEHGEAALTVHAVDESGASIASGKVDDDGTFAIATKAVDQAHFIVLAGEGVEPSDRERTVRIRPAAFRKAIEVGELALGPRDWGRFIQVRRCADATIRRCFPWWPVIEPLLPTSRLRAAEIGGPGFVGPTRIFPPFRCAPVCEGVVEVYRRTCCCHPPIFEPPVLVPVDPIPLPDPFPDPLPDPFPGPFPGPQPGPDPVPFDVLDTILTEGALDVRKQNSVRDRLALRQLTGVDLREYLVARPWLWCTCGAGTKVGEGFVGEDGRIHVCWWEPLRFIGSNCHDEYSFVVKQNIGGSTVTIYNGPGAGQWFDADDDDVRLTSYHLGAVTCRDDEFPVDPGMPFVVLQDLGTTESHRLRTPLQDGPNSVLSFGANSGLLDANGIDHALGGTLRLRYHFSENMSDVGAAYYRVQLAPAGVDGDPTDDWETLPVPTWKTWVSSGSTIEPGAHALGPHTVGTEADLFHIPFDTGTPLAAHEEWQDGQYHADVPTSARSAGRYLVRIQVFDAAGNQMDPAGGTFSFRRWNTPTTTIPVDHEALTHGIVTDNRPVHGDIVDVVGPGAGAGDCKFFVGPASNSVGFDFAATHPAAGNSDFLLSWSLSVRRGINGGIVAGPVTSTSERASGGVPQSFSIGQLLGDEAKCSFTANLHVYARIHNGVHRISAYDRHDQASFAVEQTP